MGHVYWCKAKAEVNHVCFECNIMFDLSITTIKLLFMSQHESLLPLLVRLIDLRIVCVFLCQYGQRTSQFISSKFVFNVFQFVRIAYRPDMFLYAAWEIIFERKSRWKATVKRIEWKKEKRSWKRVPIYWSLLLFGKSFVWNWPVADTRHTYNAPLDGEVRGKDGWKMAREKKCRVYYVRWKFIEIPVKISHSSNDKETLNHIIRYSHCIGHTWWQCNQSRLKLPSGAQSG